MYIKMDICYTEPQYAQVINNWFQNWILEEHLNEFAQNLSCSYHIFIQKSQEQNLQ